jgi:hypothetical protein
MKAELSKLTFGRIRGEEIVVERFCDNDVCEIDFVAKPLEENEDEAEVEPTV